MLRFTLSALICCLVCVATGCSHLPKFGNPFGGAEKDLSAGLKSTALPDPFQTATEAKQNNAVVLQVLGSKTPSRIIPLPTDGSPVFVSNLLKQSGLTEKFPRMTAKLHRDSPNMLSGIKMGIQFLPKSNQVAPEYDYALRPGDRIEVAELETSPLDALGDTFSPGRNRRLIAY